MPDIDREALLNMFANFIWFFGQDFFIETPVGNFHWKDPDYNGDNTMTLFAGTYGDFCKYLNVKFGRDKGQHLIGSYCGDQFELIIPQLMPG